jgi:NAD+ synthase
MRDYKLETEKRIKFIQDALAEAHADGIIIGNSGGKDSALVMILCKMACENTESVIIPSSSKRNFTIDKDDGMAVSDKFNIKTRVLDITPQKELAMEALGAITELNQQAITNLAPRLRMLSLYAIGASENRLVAGTGNASEYHMGYFTKWGDGACDFNPISDLTATEVFEFLEYLKAPRCIIDKAPSAGLYDGQTDEQDMGVTYKAIDTYILTGEANEADKAIIDRYHSRSEHKRRPITMYKHD